jgi:hypothetical protein
LEILNANRYNHNDEVMMEKQIVDQQAKSVRIIRILARIFSVPIILFTIIILFAHILFPDTETGTYPPVENLLPVLMTVSVLGLVLAWWREGLGGAVSVIFFIIHLLAYWAIRDKFFPLNVVLLFSPVFIIGVLFLICWWKRPL